MHSFRRTPWWMYAGTVIVLNIARQAVFPPSQVGTAATIGLFFAVLAVGIVLTASMTALFSSGERD